MRTFDYETAWLEVARPAYESLPQNVRDLLARVAVECAELSQSRDLSMPWPEDSDLRVSFDKVPAEFLALAARVIYFAGHWYPGKSANGYVIHGREHGGTWKFAHYADQSLKARLDLPTSNVFQIHEGVIRVCYSSRDMWSWTEVAPATAEGLAYARAMHARIQLACGDKRGHDRDNAAYVAIEALKTEAHPWPEPWLARLMRTDLYMVEESAIEARRAANMPPLDREKLRKEWTHAAEVRIDKIRVDLAGKIWLLDRGLPTDNAIYYGHTGRWAFGWRKEIAPEVRSLMLDHLAEFPYDYDFVSPR